MDLHVDDGYVTRPAESMKNVFAYLETKMFLKFSPIISVGSSFEHVGALEVGMWVRELDKYELSVLSMMKMRRVPSSRNRLSLETIIHVISRSLQVRSVRNSPHDEAQATARWMCQRFRHPNQKSWTQLVKKGQIHQRLDRLGDFHAEVWQSRQHRSIPRWRLGWWMPIAQPQQDDWTKKRSAVEKAKSRA